MGECKCGCGGKSITGDFMPGHDQTLRSRLEKDVGGLLAMEQLVIAVQQYTSGELSGQEFEQRIRQLMYRASLK